MPEQWADGPRAVDFYDAKGDVESLLALSGREAEFVPVAHPALHPGQSAAIVQHGERVGVVGMLHPALASELKLQGAVLFELHSMPSAPAVCPDSRRYRVSLRCGVTSRSWLRNRLPRRRSAGASNRPVSGFWNTGAV